LQTPYIHPKVKHLAGFSTIASLKFYGQRLSPIESSDEKVWVMRILLNVDVHQ